MSSSESSRQKSVLTFLIPATFLFGAGVTYLVHKTGGTPSIYANLILIPIVLTALFSPVWYSALFAALSGIAMGPLITYLNDGDTSSWTWLIRALIYIAVSIVILYLGAKQEARAALRAPGDTRSAYGSSKLFLYHLLEDPFFRGTVDPDACF